MTMIKKIKKVKKTVVEPLPEPIEPFVELVPEESPIVEQPPAPKKLGWRSWFKKGSVRS